MQAEEYYSLSNFETAVKFLTKCRETLGKTNPKIQSLLVKSYYGLGEYSEARIELSTYFDLADKDEKSYNEMILLTSPIIDGANNIKTTSSTGDRGVLVQTNTNKSPLELCNSNFFYLDLMNAKIDVEEYCNCFKSELTGKDTNSITFKIKEVAAKNCFNQFNNTKSDWVDLSEYLDELYIDPISNKYIRKGGEFIKGKSKHEIYTKTLDWVNTNYSEDEGNVMELYDSETGVIIVNGKGKFQTYKSNGKSKKWYVKHTLILEFKNEALRYTFTDFSYYWHSGKWNSGANFPFEKKGTNTSKKMRTEVNDKINSSIEELIKSILDE